MKILFIVIPFLIAAASYGQQPVIEKVTSEICDTLSKMKKSIESLSQEESIDLVRTAIIKNYSAWTKEFNEFKKISSNAKTAEYDFDIYFQHILQINCPKFRIINDKLDTYLSNEEKSRLLYLRTKKFIIELEDGQKNKELTKFFSDSLKNRKIDRLLNTSKLKLKIVKGKQR